MALLSIGEILDLGNSSNMSAYIPYSALDYTPTGAISGISGSAIAGGVESSVVSSIVSSMVSSKADQSALEDCCSSMSSVVSSIQNDVSSISSYVSGLTGDYLEKSASSMFAPSGDYATTAYVDSSVSSKMDATASGYLQPSGDYAYNSSLSSYLPASASGDFITSTAGLAPSGDYAYNSAVSGKLDASASSQFALSGDYAYNSSLTGYIPFSSVSGESNLITAINGSAISGQGGGGGGGGIDSATCSAIASAYAESAVSSYVPYSALKNGPTTATISAIDSSAVYDYSAHARISTLSTSRIPYSALESADGVITAISGTAIGGTGVEYSGVAPIVVDNAVHKVSADSVDLTFDSSMTSVLTDSQLIVGVSTAFTVPVQVVSSTALATGAGIVYVVQE